MNPEYNELENEQRRHLSTKRDAARDVRRMNTLASELGAVQAALDDTEGMPSVTRTALGKYEASLFEERQALYDKYPC